MKFFRKAVDAFRNARMQNKLIGAFVLLSFLPLAILGYFSAVSSGRTVKEKIGVYAQQLVNQVAHNIDTNLLRIRSYTDDIIISADISNRLFGYKDLDNLEQASVRNYFFMKLQLGFLNMQHIDDVMMLFTKDQQRDLYDYAHVAIQYRWPQEEINRIIRLNEARDNFKNFTISVTPIDGTSGQNVVIGRKIGNTPTLEVLGHLMVAVRQDFFNEIYRDVAIGQDSHVFLIDDAGVMIAGTTPAGTIGAPIGAKGLLEGILDAENGVTVETSASSGTALLEVAGEPQLVSWSRVGSTSLYAVMTVPYSYLNRETANLALQILLSSLILLMLSVAVAYVLSRSISAPLKRLERHMTTFGSGTLHQKTVVDRDDEVGHLQRSFNEMTGSINDLMARIDEENRMRRMTELRVLEYQVNPHFLYNTLDSINWMAVKAGQPEIGRMVTALARFYRLGLSKGREEYSIREEIEHVRYYLIISQIRYKESFTWEEDVDPDILELRTLRIILQPLAENAIKYGVDKQAGGGLIRVEGAFDGEVVRLTIRDNGRGMAQEEVNRLNGAISALRDTSDSESGFGLLNLQQRIRLTYGAPYGLFIESTPGTGTAVTVTLPAGAQPG